MATRYWCHKTASRVKVVNIRVENGPETIVKHPLPYLADMPKTAMNHAIRRNHAK
jgi:hypothetical protein